MRLSPMKRYTEPSFPTRDILHAHPELLRLVPMRWRENALVLSALTSACLLMSGCRTQSAGAQPLNAPSRVAPLFIHGEGQGSFGCMAVNPPVFLSEAEARQVIVDEAKLSGIQFTPDKLNLNNITVPVTNQYGFLDREEGGKKEKAPSTQQKPLTLDGTDEKKAISYEYVSEGDFKSWEKDSGKASTVSEFNIRDAASILHDGLAKAKPSGAVAVFYDPMAGIAMRTPEDKQVPFTSKTLVPASLFQSWNNIKTTYNEKEKTVSMTGKKTLVFTIDSDTVIVDGKTVKLPCKAILRYETPYLPLEFTVKELGGKLKYEEAKKTVKVAFSGSTYETSSLIQQITVNKQQVTVAFEYADWKSKEVMAKDTAREELRKQVKDFITWLKTQCVI
ncbi:MAG: copper amine oxidase N-terminal domain-containing protein [Armatimonadota bacterium]